MNVIPENTVIHFAAGNYNVSNLGLKRGFKLMGAGKDVTNFLWDGESQLAMISCYSGDGVEVSDLTLNGQQDRWGVTPNGINTYDCNDVRIHKWRMGRVSTHVVLRKLVGNWSLNRVL
jgi:hypothetical protein